MVDTIIEQVKEVLDGLHNQGVGGELQRISPAIASFDCMPDLCVLVHHSSGPEVHHSQSVFHAAACRGAHDGQDLATQL